jgi:hypothetical protein
MGTLRHSTFNRRRTHRIASSEIPRCALSLAGSNSKAFYLTTSTETPDKATQMKSGLHG